MYRNNVRKNFVLIRNSLTNILKMAENHPINTLGGEREFGKV
jgi:hypothetical protein